MKAWSKLFQCALLAGALFLQLNCGGGGSAGGGGTPPPSNPPSNGALAIVTTSLPDVIEGKPYSQTLQATGGKAPYSWKLAAGRMPEGISFSSSGLISGTTTWYLQAGDFSFMAEVTDAAGTKATSSWIRLVAIGVFKITTTSFPAGDVGIAYSQGFWATAGTPVYSYSLLSGSLPPGLTMNSGGLISGTPEQSGSFTFTVRGKDSSIPPMTADATFTIDIGNHLGFATGQELPPAVQYSTYSTTIKAVGGTPPYTWALNEMSWALPEGLTLDSLTGRISGTPTVSSNWVLQIDVTDSSQPMQKATKPFFLSVRSPLAIRTPYVNDAVVANAYVGWVIVDGGIAPYSLQLTDGSLPVGINLQTGSNNIGQFMFSGTPTTLGTSTFTLQATDSQTPPAVVTKTYSLRVIERLKATFPTALPNTLTGQPYTYQFSASGGTPPYNWTLTNPPSGLTIDRNTGMMTGTPTAAFDGYLSVNLRDSGQPSQSAYGNPRLHIAGLLNIATSSLPPVVENSNVNLQLVLTGGTGPFSWRVSSGSLPAGLVLSTTGAIQGTPTGTGTSSFTVSLSDQGPPAQQATASFSLPVVATPGRNNTIETATPLSNGTYAASISPMSDPPSGIASPDVDVYRFTATPGAIVKVEIIAERLTPSSPLDSVIELVDANGTRLKACNHIGLGMAFNAACMNDDVWDNSTIDSRLFLQVPGTGSAPVTFYVKVLDFRGDSRPDLRYQISATGVN